MAGPRASDQVTHLGPGPGYSWPAMGQLGWDIGIDINTDIDTDIDARGGGACS